MRKLMHVVLLYLLGPRMLSMGLCVGLCVGLLLLALVCLSLLLCVTLRGLTLLLALTLLLLLLLLFVNRRLNIGGISGSISFPRCVTVACLSCEAWVASCRFELRRCRISLFKL
jgi:hypothetical protein